MIARTLALAVALAACGPAATPAPTLPEPTEPVAPPPAPGPTVKWTELDGNVRTVTVHVDDSKLRKSIPTELASIVDKPLDRGTLRDRLAVVMKQPGVADVAASGVQRADGIELVVDVTLHPIVRKITAVEVGGTSAGPKVTSAGRKAPSAGRKVIDMDAGEGVGLRLDGGRLQNGAEQIRGNYLERGYLLAEVTWKRVPFAGGVEIVYEVTPGEPALIDAVKFTGNKAVASDVLGRELAQFLPAGSPVQAEAIERASLQINAYYWDRGYANVQVRSPEAVPGHNTLVYTIEEGPIFKIGKLAITGVPAIDHARYLKLFRVKTGDIFSRTAIAEGRNRVSDAVVATGKKTANVLPLTNVDLAKRTIDLTLEITGN